MFTYYDCERMFNSRKKGWPDKRISHNQRLLYDKERDCYMHKHHDTITVRIYRDKYVVSTGGWDTFTTWRKIREFAPIRVCGRPVPSCVNSKFVFWYSSTEKVCYTEFYDGIEISPGGVPLAPQPVDVYRARKGAYAEFNELARKVRAAVTMRMLVGEFDDEEIVQANDPMRPDEVYKHMQLIAARSEGLFKEFIPAEDMWPLFTQRPTQVFGVTRGRTRWGTRHWSGYEQVVSPAKTRLASNINAAKRAWARKCGRSMLYEIVERNFT